MRNIVAEQNRAESIGHLYSSYLQHLDVQLPELPQGVTLVRVDTRLCGCRKDDCFFCVAVDDALDQAVWADEEAERYGWDLPWED